MGLSTERLNPRNINLKFFNVKDCEEIWGAECLDIHEFRYRKFYTNVDLIFQVEELWPKVYYRHGSQMASLVCLSQKVFWLKVREKKFVGLLLQLKCKFKVCIHIKIKAQSDPEHVSQGR